MRRLWMWLLAVVAAGGVAGAGGCKREPVKAWAGSSAPSVDRPVRAPGPTGQQVETEDRAKVLANMYDLPELGAGKAFTAPDGEDWARYDNGMMIHELRPSDDGLPPRLGQTVSVSYVGTFPETNKIFDQRDAAHPLTFRMGSKDLIEGFSLALQGMHPGGKRHVYLPADLAYGSRGSPQGNIPPGQALVFEIELLSVKGEAIEITKDDLPKFEPLGPPAPGTGPASAPATRP